jgi:predicted GNAT superfamily acetyltransferase
MIRPFETADLAACHALNQANVPEVGGVTVARLRHVVDQSALCLVAEDDAGGVAGFVCVMDQDAAYDSPNFLYFKARNARFAYVDRVAVDAAARGLGLGRALYEAVVAWAAEQGFAVLCAEVNEHPPNPVSMAFHARFGFEPVGRQDTDGGAKTVALLERRLGG